MEGSAATPFHALPTARQQLHLVTCDKEKTATTCSAVRRRALWDALRSPIIESDPAASPKTSMLIL